MISIFGSVFIVAELTSPAAILVHSSQIDQVGLILRGVQIMGNVILEHRAHCFGFDTSRINLAGHFRAINLLISSIH